MLLTQRRMTGADDGAIAPELDRIVFLAANKERIAHEARSFRLVRSRHHRS